MNIKKAVDRKQVLDWSYTNDNVAHTLVL